MIWIPVSSVRTSCYATIFIYYVLIDIESMTAFNSSSTCDGSSESMPWMWDCGHEMTINHRTGLRTIKVNGSYSETDIHTTACLKVGDRQRDPPTMYPTRYPGEDSGGVTSAPSQRTTSLLDLSYSFMITNIVDVSLSEDELLREYASNMTCGMLGIGNEYCECGPGGLHIINSTAIGASTISRRLSDIEPATSLRRALQAEVSTPYLLLVIVNVTVNTIDFRNVSYLSVDEEIDSSLISIRHILTNLFDQPAFYTLWLYLWIDQVDKVSLLSSILAPTVEVVRVIGPSDDFTGYATHSPTLAPTSRLIDSALNQSPLGSVELLGLTLGITGFFLLPFWIICCFCRKIESSEQTEDTNDCNYRINEFVHECWRFIGPFCCGMSNITIFHHTVIAESENNDGGIVAE